MRLATAEGIDENLMRVIAANSRLTEERRLDLGVQIATNLRGGAVLLRMVEQHGRTRVDQAMSDILSYTAERLRRRVLAFEGASGNFITTYLNDGGLDGDPAPITATVSVADGRVLIDLEGTGKQAPGRAQRTRERRAGDRIYCLKAEHLAGVPARKAADRPPAIATGAQ